MEEASSHVYYINNLLKNIKSTLYAKFIRPYTRGISITTNNIPTPSNLFTIEQYFKLIEGINHNEVSTLCFPQSKSYLKIIDILYFRPISSNFTSKDITNFISQVGLFESISLASRPRVIKAFPKSDIVIV